MKTIMLGVFHSFYWEKIKSETDSLDFWDFYTWYSSSFKTPEPYADLWDGPIAYAIIEADKINFLLDRVHLPLNIEESVTCKELYFILHFPDLLNKTEFWLNGSQLNKEKVLKVIQSVKENELRFDNLNLDTF